MSKGCIHIYTGDGKGKTTAAVGLAVRYAGYGGKVLFTQFLKDGSSCEVKVLHQLEHVTVYSFTEHLGFSFCMNEEEKRHAAQCYSRYLEEILAMAVAQDVGLLVMDEIIGAYNLNFVEQEKLVQFLKTKPEHLEVVMTGRKPAQELVELADYLSEVKKVKHPFDQGICAREGVEY